MKIIFSMAFLAAFVGCAIVPEQEAQPEAPRQPTLKTYNLTVTLVEQEGDPRGVQLIMRQMYLPAFATAYFWSTWQRRGNAYASTREGEFYNFQAARISVADGPEGMKLGTHRLVFQALEIPELPHQVVRVRLSLNELASTELRRTDLTTVFVPRALRQINASTARARLHKVELVEGEGLVGTVWVANY